MSTNRISNHRHRVNYNRSNYNSEFKMLCYNRYRSESTSSSDNQRNCERSGDRRENCDRNCSRRRSESGVNKRHSRNRDRHHTTSRSCRHYSHRRLHRSRSSSNECHGSRRQRSINPRGFKYNRDNSSTSSSDCRTSRKWVTKNELTSTNRSSRTKSGRKGRRSASTHQPHKFQQSSRSESSRSRSRDCVRSKNCDGQRNRSSTYPDQPRSHQQSYRSENCCGGSSTAYMKCCRSENGNGLCIACNGDRFKACPSLASTLRQSISSCEKSTQTDTVDLGYTNHPTYQDASTGNDYTDVLPDLNDYDLFLDPLFVNSFMDSPAARDDKQLGWKSTNASNNFDGADNSNQTAAETLVQRSQSADGNEKNTDKEQQSQPADGNGKKMDREKNEADGTLEGTNQQLKMFCRVEMTRIPDDKKHFRKVMRIHKVKNINPEWHSLSEKMDCKICGMCFNRQGELVKHYVIVHPTAEVFPSRVAPGVAKRLRSSESVHQCKRFRYSKSSKFEQLCYFCNQSKILTKRDWSNHLASHTGCFEFTSYQAARESESGCESFNVRAFLCDFCNYVRFSKTDMENHLKNEHERDATNVFKEVIFLRFLRYKGDRWQLAGQFNGRVNWFKYSRIGPPAVVKNNNPDWHCLNQDEGCIICRSRDCAAFHYVNVHPNAEVIISRLEPYVANFLRSLKYFPECKILDGGNRRLFEQNCFFCNELKAMCKHDWIEHMISHTGYYRRQCSSCLKMLRRRDCLTCKAKGTITDSVRLFEGQNLIGYLCDLCNFIRFDRKEIQKHLRNEHDSNNGLDDYEDILFLTFPDHGKRRCLEANQSIPIVAGEPLPEIEEIIAETNAVGNQPQVISTNN